MIKLFDYYLDLNQNCIVNYSVLQGYGGKMDTPSKKNKARRRYLIYPRFQLLLIMVNTLIMAGTFGFVALQTYLSFERLREMGLNVKLDPSHAYFKFVNYQESHLYGYLLVALAAGFIISLGMTLFLSHRLAGPLVRLRKHFEMMGDSGKYVPVQFRKGDFFKELPPVINRAIESIAEHQKGESAPRHDKAA